MVINNSSNHDRTVSEEEEDTEEEEGRGRRAVFLWRWPRYLRSSVLTFDVRTITMTTRQRADDAGAKKEEEGEKEVTQGKILNRVSNKLGQISGF